MWHVSLLKLLPVLRPARTARVVLFLHGIEAWPRQSWLDRLLLRRVDMFFANSNYTWQRFAMANHKFANAPRQVIELGVGAPPVQPPTEAVSPPAALMLGRLLQAEDYKGHREVIGAWPQILRDIPRAQLWIAGDGDLRPDLEALVSALQLRSSVTFWGAISDEQKEGLLARSRCLVLPSRAEGFGLVYLEAMRLGRPCLVSTEDAGREVVNPPEAGLAANPDKPEALANAIRELLGRGAAWDTWSAAARARYADRFTARHFQHRLLAALAPLLDGALPV